MQRAGIRARWMADGVLDAQVKWKGVAKLEKQACTGRFRHWSRPGSPPTRRRGTPQRHAMQVPGATVKPRAAVWPEAILCHPCLCLSIFLANRLYAHVQPSTPTRLARVASGASSSVQEPRRAPSNGFQLLSAHFRPDISSRPWRAHTSQSHWVRPLLPR